MDPFLTEVSRQIKLFFNCVPCLLQTLALVIYPAFLLLFSPRLAELKPWSWSSWRRFVSWEEATKLFSPRSTTLRRYRQRGGGDAGSEETHMSLRFNCAVSKGDSAPEECSAGRCETFLRRGSGLGALLFTDDRQQFSCITKKTITCVPVGFWKHIKGQSEMSDSLVWSCPARMRYSGRLKRVGGSWWSGCEQQPGQCNIYTLGWNIECCSVAFVGDEGSGRM